ncbi:helix-turn-helix transcriptional regulator, partial [Streptomyces sp. NPDC005921]
PLVEQDQRRGDRREPGHDLAATGLSNKEIGARLYISPRTVSTHLYNIFPKLGIRSRAALRDALGAQARAEYGGEYVEYVDRPVI